MINKWHFVINMGVGMGIGKFGANTMGECMGQVPLLDAALHRWEWVSFYEDIL